MKNVKVGLTNIYQVKGKLIKKKQDCNTLIKENDIISKWLIKKSLTEGIIRHSTIGNRT